MALIKTGDDMPVLSYYEDEKPLICEVCKKPKIVVALKNDEQEIICDCDIESAEQN